MGRSSTEIQQEVYIPNAPRYPGVRVHDWEKVIMEKPYHKATGYDILFDTTLKVLCMYILDKNADLRTMELALKKFRRGFQELQSEDRINIQTLTEIVAKSIEGIAAKSRAQR